MEAVLIVLAWSWIVFIDEIDAVGRSRGAGFGGGHDEREQTLMKRLLGAPANTAPATLPVLAAAVGLSR